MSSHLSFARAVKILWLRFATLAILGVVFAEALFLGRGKVQDWTFYLTTSEVVFEGAVRLVFGALAAIVLASACELLLVPFLGYFSSRRERIVDWATRAAVVIVVFLDSRFALTSLIKWSNRGVRFTRELLIAHFLLFVIALCIRQTRKELTSTLDLFLGPKSARLIPGATAAAALVLAVIEFAAGKPTTSAHAGMTAPQAPPNILLITFDALDAEDMSVYGYRLPTTPNIEAFARQATVFKNYYSASTFTTPTVATMMTGLYPSESHIHQLQSRVRGEKSIRNLPNILNDTGYATAAFVSNPFAFYLAQDVETGFDYLPEPVFQEGGLARLWNATRFLHQDSGIGSRVAEYMDLEDIWNDLGGIPGNLAMRYPPDETFTQAEKMLAGMPDGYFVWVHVITPHYPYLPAPPEHGRFLPQDQVTTLEEETGRRWVPHYDPEDQSQVDQRRLRYDEFLLTADRAFGKFISDLRASEKFNKTTIIVSADHGESFEGGVYQHGSPYLTRPVVHVPLIIKTPSQIQGKQVLYTVDQTSLAPTILELAGEAKPEWMSGHSLVSWLHGNDAGAGKGLAFTQFFQKNSVFKPLRHGTVGAIDSEYEYVFDVETQKGSLRPLNQAQYWNLDVSAANPARAEALRAAILARFPQLGEQK